ncbi:hypothetical protein GmHk_08G023313 [Glycine max]|nr:hypothetical protein GmHk_08G023313 [Glycine max]
MLEAVVLLKKMGVQIESKKKKEILVGVVLFLSMKKKKNCFITTTTLGYGTCWGLVYRTNKAYFQWIARHLTETSMRAWNSDVYGFLEPQSIQRSGQS